MKKLKSKCVWYVLAAQFLLSVPVAESSDEECSSLAFEMTELFFDTLISGEAPERTSQQDQVCSLAKEFIGKVKYKFGGTNPKIGLDCSGFVRYVYEKSCGVQLCRTSKDQYISNKAIPCSDCQPGDLIFFDTRGSNNGKVNHVGICLGDGDFIHITPKNKPNVTIHDFTKNPWRKMIVGCRRVVCSQRNMDGE